VFRLGVTEFLQAVDDINQPVRVDVFGLPTVAWVLKVHVSCAFPSCG
jgi:hypothetical protein